MAQAVMRGTRLAFVVVAQEPDALVERVYTLWNKKERKIERKMQQEPAGFLVYFPRGHAIRIKDLKTLRHYGLDKAAQIIDMQGLSDPNTPLGRLMLAQDDAARVDAMDMLKGEVIQMVNSNSGQIVLTEKEQIPEWVERD